MTITANLTDAEASALTQVMAERFPAAAALKSVRLRDGELRATIDPPGAAPPIEVALVLHVTEEG